MIRAILWAQWKSIRILRSGRSSWFSALTSTLWYGLWGVVAIGLGSFTADPDLREQVESLFPAVLIFVIIYWQLAPILVASLGASLDLKKLLAYPIPTGRLFWIEVMLRVTTGIEMLLILAGGAIGLILSTDFGGWRNAPRIVLALSLFVAFNLLLASGIRGLMERLLNRKHLREIFVAVVVLLSALPQLLVVTGVPRSVLQRLASQDSSVLTPWIAGTRITLHGSSAVGWVVLLAWTAAAYWFGRWQFESNLRFDSEAAQATKYGASAFTEDSWRTRLFRLPSLLLPDPIGAIVEKELRTLARTPRFRLVFILGFTFGLVVWLPLVFGRRSGGTSVAGENFLTLVCLYALVLLGQVTYWNAFGFDRSAAQAYFVLPAPISRALIGKNLAAGVFVILEMLAVTTACLLLRLRPSPIKVLEAFLVTPVVAMYLMAAGNLSSVHMPRPLNPDRAMHGGAAGRSQAFMLLAYPLALLPMVLAYGARYAFDSELAFYVLLAFAAGLGVVVYWIALDSAVTAAESRKEQIVSELSRADGPVATE